MGILNQFEPQNVLNYFEEICAIPHPTFHEKALCEYLVDFAKKRNLEVVSDDSFNVIIKKKASKGRENDDVIILQAHTDMVTVAGDGHRIDFKKEAIIPYIDGDLIKAKGTSLGADDGIGIALILGILDSGDFSHPALECVFTSAEEEGLIGANALDYSLLKGKKLINLDSEEDYQMVIGCAGGCRANLSFEYEPIRKFGRVYELSIEGLKGGHSGIEIDKGYANANVLMGRLLYKLSEVMSIDLISIYGGEKDNAICLSCKAKVLISKKDKEIFTNTVEMVKEEILAEYLATEPDFDIKINKRKKKDVKVLSYSDFLRVVSLLIVMPNGVIKMSQYVENLVETSLNIGILRVGKGKVYSSYAIRSNIDSGRDWLTQKVTVVAKSLKADIDIVGQYPAWENKGISEFARSIMNKYKKLFNTELKVLAIHAGLECGLFYKNIEGLDAVSIGPTLLGVHTVNECASIKSVQKEWMLLKEILNG